MKKWTAKQASTAHQRAVLAAENLLQDDDRADEIEAMTDEEYATSKGAEIVSNPKRSIRERKPMATLRELRSQVREKDEYIQDLEDRLSEISGMASIADEDDPDSDDDENDE